MEINIWVKPLIYDNTYDVAIKLPFQTCITRSIKIKPIASRITALVGESWHNISLRHTGVKGPRVVQGAQLRHSPKSR